MGYRYYSQLRRHSNDPITNHQRIIIFTGAAFGAFAGSHVLGVLENPSFFDHLSFMYFMGNKSIVGGLMGGLICVELLKKAIRVTASSGDLMVYPLILAMIIGRMGCFFAGLEDGTYGVATQLPWGINFGDGIRRHPTNLYEIFFWMMLWLSLHFAGRRFEFADGARFKIFLSSYLVFRLLIEFIKPAYIFGIGVSMIQLVCVAGILYYYKVFFYPSKLIKRYARTPVRIL